MFVRVQFTRSASVLAAFAAAALIAPTAAAAAEERPVLIQGEPANVRTERVSFTRLNLSIERDQKRLNHRVGAAVERVCLRDIGRDGLQDRGYDACSNVAWNGAAPQIANAIKRAREIAMNGSSTIAASAITISAM